MRENTIGQYYPADSLLHQLDPRVKLSGTVVFLISVFFCRGFFAFVWMTLFLAAMIRLSHVPFGYMVRGLKPAAVLLFMTAVLDLFLTNGAHVVWQWKFVCVTQEGAAAAAQMVVRLSYLVLGTSIMTLTTTPKRLTDGLEKSLRPLRILHIPVHEMAMVMGIALRFIPILTSEADHMMQAQKARGADFENKNIIKRVKALMPLLVPLFASALRRGNELALAMEARCCQSGAERTKMKPLIYEKRDYLAYAGLAVYLVLLFSAGPVSDWIAANR